MTLAEWNSLAVTAMERLVGLLEASKAKKAEDFWRAHLQALNELQALALGKGRPVRASTPMVEREW